MAVWSRRLKTGDEQLEDFRTRFSRTPLKKSLLNESWDWQQVRHLLLDQEKPWARQEVWYVEPDGLRPGLVYLTDTRVLFAMGRGQVLCHDLAATLFAGQPEQPGTGGDFLINLLVAEDGGEPEPRSMLMKVRNRSQFRDFFPTFLACAIQAGANIAGGFYDQPAGRGRAADPGAAAPTPPHEPDEPDTPADVVEQHGPGPGARAREPVPSGSEPLASALVAFLASGELVRAEAAMVDTDAGSPVRLLVTDTRLLIFTGSALIGIALDDVMLEAGEDGEPAPDQVRCIAAGTDAVMAVSAGQGIGDAQVGMTMPGRREQLRGRFVPLPGQPHSEVRALTATLATGTTKRYLQKRPPSGGRP